MAKVEPKKVFLVAPLVWALFIFQQAESLSATIESDLSEPAYQLLAKRTIANRKNFYVYQNADSGFNHGVPSGFFGATSKINIDTACINDPTTENGCSTDQNRLNRKRGTVLRISFQPLSPGEVAGVNIEEPENWGQRRSGVGYDLRDATHVVFEVRTPIPVIKVQFGVGECVTDFFELQKSLVYTTLSIPLSSLKPPPGLPTPCPPNLNDVHIVFTVVTNSSNAPDGGTILLDNVRFEPVPASQQSARSFPISTRTFGVVPLSFPSSDRVPFPLDQVLRNLTTTYESALTLLALVARGMPGDLGKARLIANTFNYTLHHDNHGDFIPVAPDNSVGCFDGDRDAPRCGLHNGYTSGDVALFNDQAAPAEGRKGDIRLSGFSCGVSPTGFCVTLDGATGGNNAFAILALAAGYKQFNDQRYFGAAKKIGEWIVSNLTDNTGTGYGGYYLGYPDEGKPKDLIKGKSVENNADIFAAFRRLAAIERQLGNQAEADKWRERANIAGDFVMEMFDPLTGRFYAGTVPVGTLPGPGIKPDGPQKGNDVINTFDFLDSNTFTTLALAATLRYRDQIDWRRPVQFVLDNFAQSVMAGGQEFCGFNIVKEPTAGPNGIAWEFTGQAVVAMRFVDRLYQESRFKEPADFYLECIRKAQRLAPFGNGRGLVASTLQDGDLLPPIEQCLSTPFQCIPERVGLAATVWAIFADQSINPLRG